MSERLAIFTICSNNYMPTARAFLASVRRFHPAVDLFVCLVDHVLLIDGLYGCGEAEIVPLESLAIPDLPGFTFRYDVMELNTAAKPFMFLYLMESRGYGQVLYFDPDIELFAPLDAVLTPLQGGAAFVLTPHVLQPAEEAEAPNDLSFLRAGTYNLGFLGARHATETLEALRWWSRRLLHHCIDDQDAGLFVDQKFIDLLPGFASAVAILRDSALNVAYWNLTQRALEHSGAGWSVDGRPLVFFHYSGFDPQRPERLSKYARRFDGALPAALAALLGGYAGRLLALGHARWARAPYAYGRFASGTPIPKMVRRMFRERHPAWPSDPFETFEAQLHQPWPAGKSGSSSVVVTNLHAFLHAGSPALRSRMDITEVAGEHLLVDWFLRHAARELELDERLVQPTALRFGDRLPPLPGPQPGALDDGRDLSVIGALGDRGDAAELARAALAALRGAGLGADGCDVGAAPGQADQRVLPAPLGRVRLLSLEADRLAGVVAGAPRLLDGAAYTVAAPVWALAECPPAVLAGFDAVDEVWAPSRSAQLMLARALHKPVLHMPIPVQAGPVAERRRAEFGLPDERVLFFAAADAASLGCHNPAGAVEAFRRIVGERCARPRPGLVVRLAAAGPAEGAAEAVAGLRASVARDPDVFLVERPLSRADDDALLCLCNAVLSLHRAEAVGLLVARAMLLGRPVIATDYGATTDLVTPATGMPVERRLVAVPPGGHPFGDGQLWADPDLDHAAWLMARLVAEPERAARRVVAAREQVQRHSPSRVAARQRARLRELGLAR